MSKDIQIEENYKILVENQTDFIIKTDIYGNCLYVNPSYCKAIGKTESELLGKSFMPYIHPEDVTLVEHFMKNLFSPPYTCYNEVRVNTTRGWRLIAWADKAVLNADGEVASLVGMGRDITDQKILEDKLLKSQLELKRQNEELEAAKKKAEESDRLKSAFLANMSHEIRTPMNGIIGFANLLVNPELSESKRQFYFEILKNSCNQLLNVINDIIDISKIETGQVTLSESSLNLNDLIKNLSDFFLPLAAENGIKLKTSVPAVESFFVLSDETKLNQVLNNLINNALKFTEAGEIEFGYSLKGNLIEFFVKDTGIGIKEEYITVIFERFRQADMTYSKNNGGTGLGLAISKAYAELFGGKIWVESEYGKGSVFYFTIPYKDSNLNRIENKSGCIFEIPDLSGKVILISEDENINYICLFELLKKTGAIIVRAENGQAAIDYCENNKNIDMILMDIKMPVLNGLEATKLIKGRRPSIPIIAVTAYALSDERQKCLETGCDDYISKPVIREELLKIIKKYIN